MRFKSSVQNQILASSFQMIKDQKDNKTHCKNFRIFLSFKIKIIKYNLPIFPVFYFCIMSSTKITLAFSKFPEPTRTMLNNIRTLIHKTDPTIKEGWKWGPAFEKNSLMMGLWGFNNHISFVFYRGAEMSDNHKLFNDGFSNAHNRMIKFALTDKINEKKLADYIREAVKIDAAGKMSLKSAIRNAERKVVLPPDFAKWLGKNKKAKIFFDGIAYTFKKEMVQLLNTAKQEETRKRRFVKITEALKNGKKEIR